MKLISWEPAGRQRTETDSSLYFSSELMESDSRSAVLGLSSGGRPRLVTHSAFQEVLLQATAVLMGTVLLGWMDGWMGWMGG